MTNVINFPKTTHALAVVVQEPDHKALPYIPMEKESSVFARVVKAVWMVTVLVWPILKWIMSIDVLFQGIRMFYHWSTPGTYYGWNFLLHFAVMSALTYFVSIYKPNI